MRKNFFIVILFLAISAGCYAQQVPVYSQYVMNEFIINPAVAGIDGMTTINLTGRKQWAFSGIKNTPETYSASISSRVLKSPLSISKKKFRKGSQGRVGLGASFNSDNNGAINRTNVQLAYAYHIFIQNYQLSFGLKAYGTQFRINSELIQFRNADPLEGILDKSSFIPDAGAGINFSTPNAHVGLSVNHLLQSAIKFGDIELDTSDSDFGFEHVRQYTLYSYYRSLLPNRDWTIEPSFLLRGNERGNFSADFSARLIYRKEYWAGLSVRTSGELVVLFGLKMKRAVIGYSFDYGFNALSLRSYGSHEVVMAFKLGDSVRRYRWLERY